MTYIWSFLGVVAVLLIIWLVLSVISLLISSAVYNALKQAVDTITDEDLKQDGDEYLIKFERRMNSEDAVRMAEAIIKAEAARLKK